MARALVALGHRVDLLTYPQGEAIEVPGLVHRRSLRLPVGRVRAGPSLAKLLLDLPFMAEAAWMMARGRYDVVHAVEEAAHLAAPFARLFRLPLVADVDSSIPAQLSHSPLARAGILPRLARALEAYAFRHAAAAITVCPRLTDGVRAQAPHTPVFQVEDPPLVDPAVRPEPRDVARLRETLGLAAGPVVLYSGNFEPYQGVDLLVEAAGRVKNVQFVFMGGERREIEAMRARSVWAGAAERCVFAGKRPPAELPAFLALADVVVSPRREGENTPSPPRSPRTRSFSTTRSSFSSRLRPKGWPVASRRRSPTPRRPGSVPPGRVPSSKGNILSSATRPRCGPPTMASFAL